MWTLVFIVLSMVFSYHCSEIYNNFNGSSQLFHTFVGIVRIISLIASRMLLIWSFWHFDWWQPIVAYVIAPVISGILAIIFQRTLFGIIASPILAIVFIGLSTAGLLGFL